jgi:uncharacterized protein (DUF983 family)
VREGPLSIPSLSVPPPILTGLACRCPRCGRGRLFRGLLSIYDSCSVCGFDLKAADSGDGPAVFIIMILGAIVAPLAIWVEFALEPPIWVHILLWPPVVIGGAIGLLRPMKGVLIALQFHHQASEHRTEGSDQAREPNPD